MLNDKKNFIWQNFYSGNMLKIGWNIKFNNVNMLKYM